MAVWECPGCHRRVPERIAVCHCGTRRDQAAPAPDSAPASRVRPRLPPPPRVGAQANGQPSPSLLVLRESWPYVVLFMLALTGAAAWGFRWQQETLPPLLGRSSYERPPVSPPPSPSGQRR